MKEYLFWVAHWDVLSPTMPIAWSGEHYEWWQYTVCSTCGPDYGAESNGLDLNLFHGTVAQMLEKYANGGEEPPVTCSNIKSITFIYADGTERVMTECEQFMQYLGGK